MAHRLDSVPPDVKNSVDQMSQRVVAGGEGRVWLDSMMAG